MNCYTITKSVLTLILSHYQDDGLSPTVRGALKFLRKGENNLLKFGNYRPLSLLSIFYKLNSCLITQRINLKDISLSKRQKAYKNDIASCNLTC